MSLFRLLAALSLAVLLAACGTTTKPVDGRTDYPSRTPPEYEGIQDGEFFIPPVAPLHLCCENQRTVVPYNGTEAPGTIVVDTYARHLYYILDGGMAVRYAIAVGREGIAFRGTGYAGRKQEWPSWQPTRNMIRTRPDLYAEYAAGLPGGLDNPLGARAIYLYRGGRDTMFRIHGTIDDASIGRATSAGCIRLFQRDAIDLYDRVEVGDTIIVRTLDESLALEGPYMDDAWGRAVPDTPENRAQLERDLPIAAAEAEAEAAAQAEADAAAAQAAAAEASYQAGQTFN